VVNKAEGRSTLELFAQFFGLKNGQIKSQVVIGDNQQGIKTVAGNPGSIAYVSIGAAEFEIDSGVPIQMLPMNGIKPSTGSVRDGSFPLSRPLNLVSKGSLSGLSKKFVDYAQSAGVHDLVQEQFFVPVKR
ncbi:MAG: hypothetical protein ACK5Q1_12560, partial [Limnobacter sp.]